LSAPVEIIPVTTSRQWRDFHHLPFKVYRDDPNWVAPLLLERKFHFQPKHNPYFQHARAAFFLARRAGEPVGRITAQIDRLHLERYNDATGHFGFIEAVDDAEVFAALLRAAEDWLRAVGMRRVIGPVSFSLWDQPGLLVEGFDTPPYVMMAHARPYFAGRIAENGYRKAEDLSPIAMAPARRPRRWKSFWPGRCAAVTSRCATSAWTSSISRARSPCCWTSSTTPGRTIGAMCR
jgi:hypothetical protein